MSGATKEPRGNGRVWGRRIAQIAYYALVVAVAVLATVQITRQVFFPTVLETGGSVGSCSQGLQFLYQAIERGRAAAERALPDESEEAPLLRFRAEVADAWKERDRIAELCAADAEHRRLLEALERLRYSEEHGVRHRAVELTALRRRVRKLMEEKVGP